MKEGDDAVRPDTAKQEPMGELEALWTASEVARYLKVRRNWVYTRAGTLIPCLRFGGLLRFDPRAIRALGRERSGGTGRVIPLQPKPS